MVTLYGIPSCDTVKKARKWLDEHGIEYRFHDYRTQGLDERRLRSWVAELGWESLLNRRGLTWRKLPADIKEGMDEKTALRVMLQTPVIIRRPLLDTGEERHLGFSDAAYKEILG